MVNSDLVMIRSRHHGQQMYQELTLPCGSSGLQTPESRTVGGPDYTFCPETRLATDHPSDSCDNSDLPQGPVCPTSFLEDRSLIPEPSSLDSSSDMTMSLQGSDSNDSDCASIPEDMLSLGHYDDCHSITSQNRSSGESHKEEGSLLDKVGGAMKFSLFSRRGGGVEALDSNNNDFYCVDKNCPAKRKRSLFSTKTSSYLTNTITSKFFILFVLGLLSCVPFPSVDAVAAPQVRPAYILRPPSTRVSRVLRPPAPPLVGSLTPYSLRRGRTINPSSTQSVSFKPSSSSSSPSLSSASPSYPPSSVATSNPLTSSPNSPSTLLEPTFPTYSAEVTYPQDADYDFVNTIHPNDTLTAEEFSDILQRFQMDALRATQLADEYGLLKEGARERLEEMVRRDSELQGPGGDQDRPVALALAGGDYDMSAEANRQRPLSLAPPPGYPHPNQQAIDRQWSMTGERGEVARPLRDIAAAAADRRQSLGQDGDAYSYTGDQNMCYSGSCEFFLMCWLSGGLIEEGCGGFLFACCSRPGRAHQHSSSSRGPHRYRDEPRGLISQDHGPVKNDPACGLTDTSRIGATRRVVGGTEAGFGSFPWQAYIRIGSSRCGGSLINKFHVVTAGHCVARARPSQIRVTLGDYILNSDEEPLPARVYRASDIKVHPRFKFTPQADRYDVAVIRLDVPVQYEPHIQPICLPEKGTDFLGHFGWAAGWGALQAGSRLRPKTLQVVDVPVIDSQLCESWHRQKGINVIIHEEMMCAGYTNGGKDSCQGDSGGPLNMQIHGRWYLAGIVSAGYSCARDRQPGIYHRVAYTSDWISWAASY